jgi:hypothetical protein
MGSDRLYSTLGSFLVPLTHLVPVGIVLHLLDGVALSIEVNQLPSPLVYLFLRNRKNIWYISCHLSAQNHNSGRQNSMDSCAGIFKQYMGARNRVGIGLSYRPARLHRLEQFIL